MFCKTLLFSIAWMPLSCNNAAIIPNAKKTAGASDKNPYTQIITIPVREGFTRTAAGSNSFAAWLRQTSLKEDRTVHLYNGQEKRNQQVQFAVVDMPVGNKDLQQCADAVMRLRAEYLFAQKRFAEIIFFDNNKTAYPFTAPFTKTHFENYLLQVFGICGSASLAKQLKNKTCFDSIAPGDVLVHGGFPGHAVIVADVAANSKGQKIFMLVQGYMPAQEIHILRNPAGGGMEPWYEVTGAEKIITPEYIFNRNELKSW